MEEELGSAEPIMRDLCHAPPAAQQPDYPNMTRPFGLALEERGVTRDRIGTFQEAREVVMPALVGLDRDGVDSDGDGEPDLDELGLGFDPNAAAASLGASPAPMYGGGARVTPAGGRPFGPAIAVAALLALSASVGRRRPRAH